MTLAQKQEQKTEQIEIFLLLFILNNAIDMKVPLFGFSQSILRFFYLNPLETTASLASLQ